jgi:uncharacterized protein YneR
MKSITAILIMLLMISGFKKNPDNIDLIRAKSTLQQIFTLYKAGADNLLIEYYPDKPTANKRVAFLWPTSGVFSGVTALLKATGDKQFRQILDKNVLPGLEQYYDSLRNPFCYQSYIASAGPSDRYYDDNIWLALDFCDLYMLTHEKKYLDKALGLWQFIMSGWDDQLGGGIYWCEQKKQSKNTCSNAPASVLAFKLFEATNDSTYFNRGLLIYNWTKTNLQDSTDHLYFDNKSLDGKISRRKYTYNSGQMLQASAILNKLTGKKEYLDEAQNIAKSAINYFTEEFATNEGKTIRLFKRTDNWFNAILFRGYTELYPLDNNSEYITIFRDNMDQLWNHVRDKNSLFSKDWKGEKLDEYKWLLDQAALVEIWAALSLIRVY